MVDRRDTQYSGTADVTGFNSGGATTQATDSSTWSGAHGGAAYTVGDIVTALKNRGILQEDEN